jgi:hypothetical protein
MLKTLHTDNPLCLNLFNIDVTEQKQILKNIMGITSKCNKVRITVVEVYNLEELLIIPELDFNSTIASSYTSRVAYSISLGTLDTNKPYKFQGIALPNPKNMKSTIMIYKAESIKDNIDEFELTDAVKEKLRVFQSNDLLSSRQILKTKYNDYEAVTKIFERRLLFFGVDLIYHSALSFNFRGERVKRGYVNGLIFGDTRTGKSKTVEALMQHFRAGDSTGGENISFAGLVGGVQKSDIGGWGITWKILPLNDRRLIKIDEFHEMNDDDIRKMSELISTGVASIQKIHSEKTMARTRLIMIANPKTGKNLNTYPYGCMGVLPIMGHHNEDVARLDFAYPLKKDDVDFKSISAKKSTNLDIDVYTSDVCHALVMWVWSRKYNDIIITTEAEEAIDRYSETQIAKYSDDLPLVPSGEHDIKLARMSVACAGMFFSTDETCTKIIVHDYHVELVYKWLEAVYSSKTMGYDAFSIDKKGRNDLVNEGLLDELGITTAIKNLLMSTDRITLASIEHIFNVDREVARMKLHVLLTSNAVELLTNNQYKKTPAFIKWLFQKKFALHDAGFKSSLL